MFVYQRVIQVSNNMNIISGWYTYPSEKYDFVSWDDDIPNIWGKNPNHQPNNNMD
jgi:hypothetical protein